MVQLINIPLKMCLDLGCLPKASWVWKVTRSWECSVDNSLRSSAAERAVRGRAWLVASHCTSPALAPYHSASKTWAVFLHPGPSTTCTVSAFEPADYGLKLLKLWAKRNLSQPIGQPAPREESSLWPQTEESLGHLRSLGHFPCLGPMLFSLGLQGSQRPWVGGRQWQPGHWA